MQESLCLSNYLSKCDSMLRLTCSQFKRLHCMCLNIIFFYCWGGKEYSSQQRFSFCNWNWSFNQTNFHKKTMMTFHPILCLSVQNLFGLLIVFSHITVSIKWSVSIPLLYFSWLSVCVGVFIFVSIHYYYCFTLHFRRKKKSSHPHQN